MRRFVRCGFGLRRRSLAHEAAGNSRDEDDGESVGEVEYGGDRWLHEQLLASSKDDIPPSPPFCTRTFSYGTSDAPLPDIQVDDKRGILDSALDGAVDSDVSLLPPRSTSSSSTRRNLATNSTTSCQTNSRTRSTNLRTNSSIRLAHSTSLRHLANSPRTTTRSPFSTPVSTWSGLAP